MKFYDQGSRVLVFLAILLIVNKDFVRAEEKTCRGAFDVYFVLDKSSSLLKGTTNHFEKETVSFVAALSRKFVNPLLRLSYITFSTVADVIMPLTDDRNVVETGLNQLKQIIPEGPTLMHLGIEKANKQISKMHDKRASMIIVLTDGKLEYSTKVHAVSQADYSRELGSTLLVVGVSNYDEKQLIAIAGGSSRFVFKAADFSQLDRVVTDILASSCIEVLSANPEIVCSNETFSIGVNGRGFSKVGVASLVKCNFWTEESPFVLITPEEVRDDFLKCSSPDGFTLNDNEALKIQISVNGGVSFISSNVTVTANKCHDVSKASLLFGFMFLLFLTLFALWWLRNYICCISSVPSSPKRSPAPQRPSNNPPAPNKKQWPAVDASFYGASGAGGMKPLPVHWGELGCTEGAMHLERTAAAKEVAFIEKRTDEITTAEMKPDQQSFWGRARVRLGILFNPMFMLYASLSAKRPTRDEVRDCIFVTRGSGQSKSSQKRGSYLDTTS